MKIGIISDTHDYLDPRVPELLKGVDHILHGGDIGLPWLLLELEFIAPVTAVSGNTDDPSLPYRQMQVIQLGGRKFLVHHIVNPRSVGDELQSRMNRERPEVVVFGHTHKPFCETIKGTLFFNPGYAGKQRFDLPRSLAILHCDDKDIRSEYFAL